MVTGKISNCDESDEGSDAGLNDLKRLIEILFGPSTPVESPESRQEWPNQHREKGEPKGLDARRHLAKWKRLGK